MLTDLKNRGVGGEAVVQLRRQRLLGGEPVMVERTTFIRAWGSLLFAHDPDDGSIYEHLIGHGLQVGIARHSIDAVQADADDADLLGVPIGAPLLRELRIAYTIEGEPFEYSDDRYRPDRGSDRDLDGSQQARGQPGPARAGRR